MRSRSPRLGLPLALMFWLTLVILAQGSRAHAEEATFEIKAFAVQGHTLFSGSDFYWLLQPYTGPGKTNEDVEKARVALEKFYHEKGYPTVLVNIPEQTVTQGVVLLQVIESRIREVRIKGNRYFTQEHIRDRMPSLAKGSVLHLPGLQLELARLNSGKDIRITPVIVPGQDPESLDVVLEVTDGLPFHGSLELNNRSTRNTTSLRLNASLSFENLWQAAHSLSVQYQTSPEDTDEVQALAASYVLPAPWEQDHFLAVFGLISESETAFGSGFSVVGDGHVLGLRYVMPLPSYEDYQHNLTLGADYKHFEQSYALGEGEYLETPVTYMPFLVSYSSSLPDSTGVTSLNLGLNMIFRGLMSDKAELADERYRARGNFIYARGGLDRRQKLPIKTGLFVKLDGQIADQPLVANEQYTAGGMDSVRGYYESEFSGDQALHTTVELSNGYLEPRFSLADRPVVISPYLFYDAAWLAIRDPLPEQPADEILQGAGLGARATVGEFLRMGADFGVVLSDTEKTEKWDTMFHFKVEARF